MTTLKDLTLSIKFNIILFVVIITKITAEQLNYFHIYSS
jgi:hypothetical protein